MHRFASHYKVDEVCKAIIENLWSESVEKHFPKSKELFLEKMKGMDCEWQFTFAFYSIYGAHLLIKCPAGGGEAIKQYHNFKNF